MPWYNDGMACSRLTTLPAMTDSYLCEWTAQQPDRQSILVCEKTQGPRSIELLLYHVISRAVGVGMGGSMLGGNAWQIIISPGSQCCPWWKFC